MKGVWITTVYNQDWPSSSSKGNVEIQKSEFINILEDVMSLGIDTIVVQIRPKSDALYKSSINPWSDILTGVQGKDPGYDPLEFILEESHKRNIKVHGWLNPYRVTTSGTNLSVLSANNFARNNPQTVIKYNNAMFYNPGLPEVREYIVNTVAEIVRNYNIDGIHFDDYFYPGENIDDNYAYRRYGNGVSLGDFRRRSVDEMVKACYEVIKSINGNVKFGISPRGIWKNKSSDVSGSDTSGSESYYDIYADTRTWIKNNWLNYVVPQVYWEIGNKVADYSKLIPWWANEVINTNVKLYIGQGIYKEAVARELLKQIELNKKYNINGSILFSYIDIKKNIGNVKDQIKSINYKNDNEEMNYSMYVFSKNWYLNKYLDVANSPTYKYDPYKHYVDYGKKEGRLPLPPIPEEYNEGAYLKLNPDVNEAVKNGMFVSGIDHYLQYGFNESRKVSY